MSQLFSPVRLGPLELSNRIVVAPMCQYSAIHGDATDWHLVHLGSLSMSGASLLVIGKLLGHAQHATTFRYAHLAHDPVAAAGDAVARRIANAMADASAAAPDLGPVAAPGRDS